ncbi:polysaccharide deacetylase family protein [Pelovirga terrestris]|uniref:Polysaccharide deacetylase family protein n=1 Tax=Pelovirga terrestris TaxID=2771352 RepID=A0A8J6QLT1_9BACT|nr:polysaccharide deacetylase family protein [Pelovirga terrestris]MBD1399532.1 polysaccharide deacetylase family protein [Pelovirga terrestris]
MVRLVMIFVVFCLLIPVVLSAGQVNSFIYHRFDDDRYPSTNIAGSIFTEQLEHLRERHIPVVSTQEISERIARGEALPDHAAMITVDDAYLSFYQAGMPIVRQFAVPVSLFVNTDAVGTPGYMSWDQIREVAAQGVEIGNHTASHAYLVEKMAGETDAQWRRRIYDDILSAQQAFERELGFAPNIFAYTYGEYSAEIIDIVKELGFIAAYGQQSGVIHQQHDPFTLPRFPMGGPFATLADFKSKVAMKALVVAEQHPVNPVIFAPDTAPVLDLSLPDIAGSASQFNCFAQGGNRCSVTVNQERGPGWYQITADGPLKGRRNKYTLTRQAPEGGWQWFSQLWINADNPPHR